MAARGQEEARNAFGGKPASRLGQYAWAVYDFATQPYFTIVSGFTFVPYFAAIYISDAARGQEIMGYAVAIGGFLIAILSPLGGAVADAAGRRKPWIIGLSALHIVSCALLWFAAPGAEELWLAMTALFVLASVTLELAVVFNNAMLPAIAPVHRLGYLSGFGYGIGYVGGLLGILFVLWGLLLPAEGREGPWLDAPLFGLNAATHEHARATAILAAVWYGLFIVPMLLYTPDEPSRGRAILPAAREGLTRLASTIKRIGRYRNIVRFLIARALFNDGLNAIFVFGPIYAAGVFGWSAATSSVFGLIVIIFAAAGAFIGGWIDDWAGAKRAIIGSLILLLLGILLALSVTAMTIFYGVRVAPADPGHPLESVPELLFLLAGILIGIGGGPAQSASRTLMARIAPDDKTAEFFGLFALSGKATSFVSPFLIAVITGATGSQRPGLFVILALLLAGLVLLLPVRETRES